MKVYISAGPWGEGGVAAGTLTRTVSGMLTPPMNTLLIVSVHERISRKGCMQSSHCGWEAGAIQATIGVEYCRIPRILQKYLNFQQPSLFGSAAA